jgi:hypothetical protein
MRWVEVVEAAAVLAVAVAAGRAAWAAPRPPARAAIVCAPIPTAGTASRIRQACLATRRNARNAERR